MELTRRTNNQRVNLSRANLLRDWGPTLAKLGKIAYQYAQSETAGRSGQNAGGGGNIGTQIVRASTKRRGKSARPSRIENPQPSLGNTFKCVLSGSSVLQTASGTHQSSRLISFDTTNSADQLVNLSSLEGTDYYTLLGFGFIKYHSVQISFHPILAATASGYAALGVRGKTDNTVATPAYIKQMPGSKTWALPGTGSVSFSPDSNHGIIHRVVQTEAPETEIDQLYLGCVKLYVATTDAGTATVCGILKYRIVCSAWND